MDYANDHNAHVVAAAEIYLLDNYDLDYILNHLDAYYDKSTGSDFHIAFIDMAIDAIRLRHAVNA